MKRVLDMTAGSRMMWFDPNNTSAVFVDNRTLTLSCATVGGWKSSLILSRIFVPSRSPMIRLIMWFSIRRILRV